MKLLLLLALLATVIFSACAPAATSTPAPTMTRTVTPTTMSTPVSTVTATATLASDKVITPSSAAMTVCGGYPPLNAQPYLKNPSFEETVVDKDGTLEPAYWGVTEGEAIKGTGVVPPDKEQPALVQVVKAEGSIRPCDGNRMLKIDARLLLKSSVHQYYSEPISNGRLIQELAVYPSQGEYAQQVEIRGQRDFKGIEGKEMFHLRWTDEGLLLRIRTGSPDFKGQSGFYRIFPPLPQGRWSFVRITLEKTRPTQDREGRTISQWKLVVELNGQTLFDSDREKVYSQYIKSAESVFIGDETMSGKTHKLKPSNTGDGIGVVYYDLVRTWD